jgi:hypothetical protein
VELQLQPGTGLEQGGRWKDGPDLQGAQIEGLDLGGGDRHGGRRLGGGRQEL